MEESGADSFYQATGVQRQIVEIPHADHQLTTRPGVGESRKINCKRLAASERGRFRNDADTHILFCQTADRIKIVDANTVTEPSPQAFRMAIKMVLEGTALHKPDKGVIEQIAEPYFMVVGQRMPAWDDNHQLIGAKGTRFKQAVINGVGDYSHIGLAHRD